ncbi:MAG: thioredoxin domain-containing protein [Acidobacteriales bacterium]|nr:thioredoxin domain-containing protein [Terriglobales bacterium]
MRHLLRRGLLGTGVCLLGLTLQAQDWKTAESLPGVDVSKLSAAQKTTVLKLLRNQGCSCGCGMKLAECRVMDPSCSYSTGLAAAIVDAIAQGKSESEALQAASASKWAHLQTPQPAKVLSDPIKIPVAGAPVTGPEKASITIVEFSDFQCPYCAQAFPQIAAVLKTYPTEVRLIFKEFPLEIHPQADLAAAAAVAAQKQGKFWQLHDAMFASRGDLSRKHILALAKQNGLDVKQFEDDLDSSSVRETVVRDVQDGDAAGVEGTPTIFINGQKYNGAIDLALLKPILDAELKPGKAQTATASR